MKRLYWMVPVVIALAVYSVSFNNFFVYDDFIWLHRATTLGRDWQQMFRPDVIYFDPLVYIMFLVDSFIAGFDARWYQAVDLALHALNAVLVYRLAELLSRDRKAGLYAGVLFASSFAIADAVVWPSSRVDLVSVLFSLGTLIQFLKYLRTGRIGCFWLSCLMFVLALGAKGTPLVLPLVLLWLVLQEKKPLAFVSRLVPFGAAVLLYLVFLKLRMSQASLPLDRLHFNLNNYELALSALFVPEGTLKYLSPLGTASFLFVVVSTLSLVTGPLKETAALRRTGYCLLLTAILPVLVVTDFKLVSEYSNPYLLLLSPSHRIYLAAVGAALFAGGVLRSAEGVLARFLPKPAQAVAALVLAGIVVGSAVEVRERNKLWVVPGEWSRDCFNGLRAFRHRVPEGSQIALINFPGSRGFTTPMVQLALGVEDVALVKDVTFDLVRDPAILGKAERSFLFVFGSDRRVYDKSQAFRQQLLFNRMALVNPGRTEYLSSFQGVAGQLDREVNGLVQ